MKIKISLTHACSISAIARERPSPSLPRAGREGQRKEGFAASIPRSRDPGIVTQRWPANPTRWSRSTNHNRACDRVTSKGLNVYANVRRCSAASDFVVKERRERRDVAGHRAASGPAASANKRVGKDGGGEGEGYGMMVMSENKSKNKRGR